MNLSLMRAANLSSCARPLGRKVVMHACMLHIASMCSAEPPSAFTVLTKARPSSLRMSNSAVSSRMGATPVKSARSAGLRYA